MTPEGLVEVTEFDTKDGIYDCAWSEVGAALVSVPAQRTAPAPPLTGAARSQENENILVSSCGDGSIKVWDVAAPASANPLRSYQEHAREARPRTTVGARAGPARRPELRTRVFWGVFGTTISPPASGGRQRVLSALLRHAPLGLAAPQGRGGGSGLAPACATCRPTRAPAHPRARRSTR